jgi:hypothetical protein
MLILKEKYISFIQASKWLYLEDIIHLYIVIKCPIKLSELLISSEGPSTGKLRIRLWKYILTYSDTENRRISESNALNLRATTLLNNFTSDSESNKSYGFSNVTQQYNHYLSKREISTCLSAGIQGEIMRGN